MTRLYRSFTSDVAYRPPSRGTIGRRAGGITGILVKNIHSGLTPELIMDRMRDRRLFNLIFSSALASSDSVSSEAASFSKLRLRQILYIASAPIPASKSVPYLSE